MPDKKCNRVINDRQRKSVMAYIGVSYKIENGKNIQSKVKCCQKFENLSVMIGVIVLFCISTALIPNNCSEKSNRNGGLLSLIAVYS